METQTIAVGTSYDKLVGPLKKIFFGQKAKRNIIVTILFLAAIGYVYYTYFGKTETVTYEYVAVAKKDIKKSVEGSGKVVSLSELAIQQLQNSGKVTAVYVKPGDFVKQGQIIATMDNRQAAIQLAQAKASYDKVVNGSTKEEMAITNQSVLNAKQSYDITKQQQDTAVASAKRTLLNTSTTPIPLYDSRIQENVPTISGSYLCTDEDEYKITFSTNDYFSVNSNKFNGQVRISSVPQALGDCGLYISVDQTKSYANGEWKVSLPSKISTSYATNLNNYNNAVQSREQALANAQTAITNAELTLNQKVAGARPEDIASAKASLASANLTYENTIVRAPFDGQIGSVSASVGQQTNSEQGVATIITKDKIAEISLNEIDIVNVKLGQQVELTFDAIPGEIFMGSIAQIDTIGINSSNVVSFATKISIPNADEKIKSGMSVTANIITEKKEGVLSIPSGTIKSEGRGENKKNYVMKKYSNGSAATSTKTFVTTGLDNDVDAEIIDGLREGDEVLSKTLGGTVAKTQSTFSLFGGGGGTRPAGATTRTTGGATR